MRIGLPIELNQPIDSTTRDNLLEWQAALTAWFPGRLRVVPIRGPIETESPKNAHAAAGALTAFSGGVDSCFTAFRHSLATDNGEYRRARLAGGLMVHGFDIPEPEVAMFASAFKRSDEVLRGLGLAAYRLSTNLRTLEKQFGCDWEYETHGIWLAAALACLEPFFEQILIPASFSYHRMEVPWGSNPVTDERFSSAATPFWHDGANYNKLEKVRAIAQHAAIRHGVRVCWEGAELDRNCGRCCKCLGTQVCYWLCGVPRPEGFPRFGTLEEVARARLLSNWNRYLFEVYRAEATRQGATELANALACALGRARRQRLRRKLKQLCLHPRDLFGQF